jgi:class 3 adenylate cyclase/tetratricopeptide (TPR) repeat protein
LGELSQSVIGRVSVGAARGSAPAPRIVWKPTAEDLLRPYVAGLARRWLEETPEQSFRVEDGTLAFVDISGFTRLTELLSTRGKSGAEELTGYLDDAFEALLAIAYENGGELVKWGGDAVLLWYSGPDHANRAVEACWRMQRTMKRVGRLKTSVGPCTLRMSVGVHSGSFHFFSVGSLHRELLVTGPAATMTAHLEAVAEAGEIIVSPATAELLDPDVLGNGKEDGILIGAAPRAYPAVCAVDDGMDRPSLSLPEPLRLHLQVQPVDSEHRQAAVAFVEFSGVGEALERLGSDGLAKALDVVMSRVQEACAAHRVTFWETDIAEDGGKVMLVAGAPTSTDDDAGQLLSAVREIIDGGGELRLRAGVNCGRIFTGGFGPEYRRTYSGKGDAINLAARLMGRSNTGQIFVSDAVLRRSRVVFDSTELASFLVKGKTQPIHAHELGARREGVRPRATAVESRFFGRDEPLEVLRTGLRGAIRGRGRCIELVGPAGIGKSRLVAELESGAVATRVISVLCDRYGASIPYAALKSLLVQCLDSEPGPDIEDAATALLDDIGRLAPDLLPFAPLLGRVLGVDVAATPEVAALDPRFVQERLELSVVRFLQVLIPGPTMLIFDDAHWMDDATGSLVRRLAGSIGSSSWMLLLARRPEEGAPDLVGISGPQRMEIAPLDELAVADLLRSLVDRYPLAPHLRDAIADRSGGNPLFLLELLEEVRRSGGAAALPDRVEGVFAAQVDRLVPSDRKILRAASVLGMTVSLTVAAEMLDDPDAARRLSELSDFLIPAGDGGLRFRQTMLRDAAYEGLPYVRRRALHARAGEVLERRAGPDTSSVAGLLSLHFGAAEDHGKAWHYARMAGDQAREIYANVEAATFYAQALKAGRALPSIDRMELAQVAESLGDARSRLGDFTRAEIDYRDARKWCDGLNRSRLLYKVALGADRRGGFRRALSLLTRSEQAIDKEVSSSAVRLRAEIRAHYGLVRLRQGRPAEAVQILRAAAALAEEADAPDVLITALVELDMAELASGVDSSGDHASRALDIQAATGRNPWLEARALNQLGIRAYYAGRWSDSVDLYRRSADACHRAGDSWTAAIENGNIAEVLADQGYFEQARPMLEEVLGVFQAAGTPSFIAEGSRILGRLASRQGHTEKAGHLLEEARRIFAGDGEPLQVQLTDAIMSESFLLAGQTDAAAELSEKVVSDVNGAPWRHLVVPLAGRVLAASCDRAGDQERARRALDQALEVARERRLRYDVAMALQLRSDLWPESVAGDETAEMDQLFAGLGVTEAGRHTLVRLPVHGV